MKCKSTHNRPRSIGCPRPRPPLKRSNSDLLRKWHRRQEKQSKFEGNGHAKDRPAIRQFDLSKANSIADLLLGRVCPSRQRAQKMISINLLDGHKLLLCRRSDLLRNDTELVGRLRGYLRHILGDLVDSVFDCLEDPRARCAIDNFRWCRYRGLAGRVPSCGCAIRLAASRRSGTAARARDLPSAKSLEYGGPPMHPLTAFPIAESVRSGKSARALLSD